MRRPPHFRPIPFLIFLLLPLSTLQVAAEEKIFTEDAIQLPDLGSPSDQYLTPAEEIRLGKAFMRNIEATEAVVTDPQISEYIQNLGSSLIKQSEAAGQSFDFFVIENPVINAFAGPGGHIGVFSGLILATQSESELASVVAHEIAHVTQKHLLRAFDSASHMNGQAAAMILAAILLGATTTPDAGIALATAAQATAIQEQINFTRSNEQEADNVGINILANAEYDPRAMPVFFERLTHANRLFDAGIPEILRTHPVTTNRIADALSRAEQYDYKQYESNFRFYLIREWLRAKQFKSPQEGVKHFKTGLDEGRYLNKEAHEYGYALALANNKEYDKARALITQLQRKRPEQVEYIIAAADIEKRSGHREHALEILATANAVMPNDYPLAISYTEDLLEAKKYKQAQGLIHQLNALRPNDARLFRLLSEAEDGLGNKAESHRLLAEVLIVRGETEAAIRQLEIASKHIDKDDFYLASQIESRTKQLKQALEQEKKNEKSKE